jgi:oxygen-independent coproporphyrinogen-3 oxidase
LTHVNRVLWRCADDEGMDRHLLKYAECSAPRYTSYPTAPHFTPEVNAVHNAQWLASLAPDARLSLYVHVPYCKRICWYCGCNTNAVHAGDTADFSDTLMQETDLVAALANSWRVVELHWGGGTPNILTPDEFTRLYQYLAFWFDLDEALIHSLEIDPRYLTGEQAKTYAAAGVTRASLGVQTLARNVQQAIGRVQPYEQVAGAAKLLREAGIGQINFDLMYGLPHQSLDDILHTVQLAGALQPNRIALFGYAHVPWFKRRQRVINESSLPGGAERAEQADAARAALTALGYVAVGIDHFALPGDPLALAAGARSMRRNFQGYAVDIADAIIGLGPSAISTFPQGYVQNETGIGAWRRAVEAGQLAASRGHVFSEDDTRRAAIIERLMCALEVDLSPYGGCKAFPHELEALAPLADDGLVQLHGDRIVIPDAARSLSRLVAQAFDAYARSSPAQHSRAV